MNNLGIAFLLVGMAAALERVERLADDCYCIEYCNCAKRAGYVAEECLAMAGRNAEAAQ